MKKWCFVLCSFAFALMISCGGSKSTNNTAANTELVSEENKKLLPLFNQITRLPGMTSSGGVPVFNSNNNSVIGSAEPLYVLNGNMIGNSFSSINEVVNAVDVKKIKALKGADAAFYGSRGSNGVILITTK